MLIAIGVRARKWALDIDPFTNVYGVARSLMALAGALTLLFNSSATLFRPVVGIPEAPVCAGVLKGSLFCAAPTHLDFIRYVLLLVLLLVVSGYRPRFTGVLHAYAAFSFQASVTPIEGGDQVHSILALLLVPVTLMDDRKWHWQPRKEQALDDNEAMRRLVARVCFALIRLQVAGIYFHAAVGKWGVDEWTDGTVLYYWFTHPVFGVPAWLAPITRPIISNGPALAALTWSVIILEYFLSAGLVANRKFWPFLMWSGFMLHAGIIVLHGLPSFSMVMWSALILYLRPINQPIAAPTWIRRKVLLLSRFLPRRDTLDRDSNLKPLSQSSGNARA